MTTIKSERVINIQPPSAARLSLFVDGIEIYNISQEYRFGYTNDVIIPANEELEIKIAVTRKIFK